MIDTLLFDYDGTLLQVDQDQFMKTYFSALIAKVVPFGYDAEQFKLGVWNGIQAMTNNDGKQTNYYVFWREMDAVFGERINELEKIVQSFYQNEFNIVAEKLKITTNHHPLLNRLREQGYTLALASNPVFPLVAVQTRLSWIGLSIDDFDHITHYENSTYCKPNLNYYQEIFKALDKKPEQCLMIGNDLKDDAPAAATGAKVYLVTDLYSKDQLAKVRDIPYGSFTKLEQFISMLE